MRRPFRAIAVRVGATLALVAAGLTAGPRDAVAAPPVGTTDYVLTQTSGLYESPPANAVAVTGTGFQRIGLPFLFPYFGRVYDHVDQLAGLGYVLFDAGSNPSSYLASAFSSNGYVQSHAADGVCAPYWNQVGPGTGGSVQTWTAGTAPERRFVISWERFTAAGLSGSEITFQIRLFEGTGRIEFAYAPGQGSFTSEGWCCGIDAPRGDPRYLGPLGAATLTGYPSSDLRMDPLHVTAAGRLVYDRLVPGPAGLGATPVETPLAGMRVELRYPNAILGAVSWTDDEGAFSIDATKGYGLEWSLHAVASSAACAVRPPGSGTVVVSAALAGPAASNQNWTIGDLALTESNDAGAAFRRAAHVCSAAEALLAWASARTTKTIPALSVIAGTGTPTTYIRAGANAPRLEVAGASAANDDAWDAAVIASVAGRHVLDALSAPSGDAFDARIDAVTSEREAFATAFGLYLSAAAAGTQAVADSTASGSALWLDLESPSPQTAPGPAVAASVAGMLFDLADPANETEDLVDGTASGPSLVLDTVGGMTAAPTAALFAEAWRGAGFDGAALSRLCVAHGLETDDAWEPNDSSGEAAAPIAVGGRRDGLVLGVANDDWIGLDVAEAVEGLRVEVVCPTQKLNAPLELLLAGPAGAEIAAASAAPADEVLALSTGALPAGTYRLRVRNTGNVRLPAYEIQAGRPIALDPAPLPRWTAGVPYDRPIAASGGVGARTLAVSDGAQPPGISFRSEPAGAAGTPVTPGVFDFSLRLADAGHPQHAVTVPQRVTIAPPVSLNLGRRVAVPLARPYAAPRPNSGGTPPFVVALIAGALPPGVALAPDAVEFSGTAAAAAFADVEVRATDSVGSAAFGTTRVVVCVPPAAKRTAVALAEGDASAGVFLDALRGSAVSCTVTTAPRSAKRALAISLLGPDGAPVAGAKAKGGSGKASVSARAPVTGRYFVVLDSLSGAATSLLAAAKVRPPASEKGTVADVTPGTVVTVPLGALAGAKLAMTAQPAKKGGPQPVVLAVLRPDGTALPLSGLASVRGTTAKLSAVLDQAGTWQVRLRIAAGSPGALRYAFTVRQPRGAVYSDD